MYSAMSIDLSQKWTIEVGDESGRIAYQVGECY